MKGITTLAAVQEQVAAMSKNHEDYLININDVSFQGLESIVISGYTHRMRIVAQRAISARLAIPFEYLRRCPVDVQTYNINFWLQHEKNEELFFRFSGEEVRAIFTPRYKPMDNVEVMERLNDLGYESETRVQAYLDDEFMALSIPDGRQTFSVNGSNDKITPGISLANSEVGLSSLKIAAFFLRLKCTNGLIVKTQIAAAYRHISRKIMDEFPNVMNEVSSQMGQQKEKFRISKDSRVEDVNATFQSFNREFQLGKQEQEAVYWGYGFEPGNTMFHIINAFTRGAEFPSLRAEESYRLQRVGGSILGMVR